MRLPISDTDVPFRSNRSLLFKFWTLCVFDLILGRGGAIGTTYDVHLGLIEKRVVDFICPLIVLNFFARCYG